MVIGLSIILKSAIVHILDTSVGLPIISENPIQLDNAIEEYISCLIANALYSDDTKECKFKAETSLWNQCLNASWDIRIISRSIA